MKNPSTAAITTEQSQGRFNEWVLQFNGTWAAHAIWPGNEVKVLKAGHVKPAEMIMREDGVVDYEAGGGHMQQDYDSHMTVRIEDLSEYHADAIREDQAKPLEQRIDYRIAQRWPVKKYLTYAEFFTDTVKYGIEVRHKEFPIMKLKDQIWTGYRFIAWGYGSFVVLIGNTHDGMGFQNSAFSDVERGEKQKPMKIHKNETCLLSPFQNRGQFFSISLTRPDILMLCTRNFFQANQAELSNYNNVVIMEDLSHPQRTYLRVPKKIISETPAPLPGIDVCAVLPCLVSDNPLQSLQNAKIEISAVLSLLPQLSLSQIKSFIGLLRVLPDNLDDIFKYPRLFHFIHGTLTSEGFAHFWQNQARLQVTKNFLKTKISRGENIDKQLILKLFQLTSPLMLACLAENIDTAVVEDLLTAGYDPNEPAVLHKRVYHKQTDTVVKPGDTVLMIAARRGDSALVEMLLKHGADKNQQNFEGKTALFFAVNHQKTDVMTQLIEQNVDPNIPDNLGRTAIFYAKTPEHAQMLLHHKANLKHCDQRGGTIVHAGLSVEMLNFFGDYDAEYVRTCVNTADQDGMVPLHGGVAFVWRETYGQRVENFGKRRKQFTLSLETATRLLELGGDLITLDIKGRSPLFFYICSKANELIELVFTSCTPEKLAETITATVIALHRNHALPVYYQTLYEACQRHQCQQGFMAALPLSCNGLNLDEDFLRFIATHEALAEIVATLPKLAIDQAAALYKYCQAKKNFAKNFATLQSIFPLAHFSDQQLGSIAEYYLLEGKNNWEEKDDQPLVTKPFYAFLTLLNSVDNFAFLATVNAEQQTPLECALGDTRKQIWTKTILSNFVKHDCFATLLSYVYTNENCPARLRQNLWQVLLMVGKSQNSETENSVLQRLQQITKLSGSVVTETCVAFRDYGPSCLPKFLLSLANRAEYIAQLQLMACNWQTPLLQEMMTNERRPTLVVAFIQEFKIPLDIQFADGFRFTPLHACVESMNAALFLAIFHLGGNLLQVSGANETVIAQLDRLAETFARGFNFEKQRQYQDFLSQLSADKELCAAVNKIPNLPASMQRAFTGLRGMSMLLSSSLSHTAFPPPREFRQEDLAQQALKRELPQVTSRQAQSLSQENKEDPRLKYEIVPQSDQDFLSFINEFLPKVKIAAEDRSQGMFCKSALQLLLQIQQEVTAQNVQLDRLKLAEKINKVLEDDDIRNIKLADGSATVWGLMKALHAKLLNPQAQLRPASVAPAVGESEWVVLEDNAQQKPKDKCCVM